MHWPWHPDDPPWQGQACALCGKPIEPGGVEPQAYEVKRAVWHGGHSVTMAQEWFHLPDCWRQALRERRY